jgi:regulatory protein
MAGEEDRLEHALGVARRYLNRRERTVSEVRRHLERKGVDANVTEQALTSLGEQGLIDDRRFARLFVQDKRALQQWGSERIRRGLVVRGIEPELISDALEHGGPDPLEARLCDAEETELDRALSLLIHRFPSPPRERRDRDRALGVLIRRGYDPELAVEALSAYARSGS